MRARAPFTLPFPWFCATTIVLCASCAPSPLDHVISSTDVDTLEEELAPLTLAQSDQQLIADFVEEKSAIKPGTRVREVLDLQRKRVEQRLARQNLGAGFRDLKWGDRVQADMVPAGRFGRYVEYHRPPDSLLVLGTTAADIEYSYVADELSQVLISFWSEDGTMLLVTLRDSWGSEDRTEKSEIGTTYFWYGADHTTAMLTPADIRMKTLFDRTPSDMKREMRAKGLGPRDLLSLSRPRFSQFYKRLPIPAPEGL